MKLIVGLGNPGSTYEQTRHNAGFTVINYLPVAINNLSNWSLERKFKSEVSRGEINGWQVVLAKPQTFMNSSGEAVAAIVNFYKLARADVLIIHDDLDIPLGRVYLQKSRGPKDHNGVLSVEERLGTPDFYRLRVGIDNRPAAGRDGDLAGEKYTLSNFTAEEQPILQAVSKEALAKVLAWLKESPSNV